MQKNNQGSEAGIPCKGIITYRNFKNDQAVAFALLRMFGKKKYPGIEKAPFIFWDLNEGTPDKKPASEWQKQGYVLVSVGNSKYDDHWPKHEGKETCSALLVAEDLGIAKEPFLQELLKNTLQRDLTGQGHPMMIYTFLKLMHKSYPDQPGEVMSWYLQAIESLILNEFNLIKKTGEEFKKNSEQNSCWHLGKEIIVSSFTSDDQDMSRFARSKEGANADVTVQRNRKGQVVIQTKNSSRIDLDQVIMLIRVEEKRVQKKNGFLKEDVLKSPGTLPEVPEWYYDSNARRILNGSGAAPNVPATQIPFDRLICIILKGLRETQARNGNSRVREEKISR